MTFSCCLSIESMESMAQLTADHWDLRLHLQQTSGLWWKLLWERGFGCLGAQLGWLVGVLMGGKGRNCWAKLMDFGVLSMFWSKHPRFWGIQSEFQTSLAGGFNMHFDFNSTRLNDWRVCKPSALLTFLQDDGAARPARPKGKGRKPGPMRGGESDSFGHL